MAFVGLSSLALGSRGTAVSACGIGRKVQVSRRERVLMELGAGTPPQKPEEADEVADKVADKVAEEVTNEQVDELVDELVGKVTDEEVEEGAEEVADEGAEEVKVEKTPGEAADEVNELLNSPAMLKTRIEILQKQLDESKVAQEALEKEVAAEKDMFVRLTADFENFRRRSDVEILESNEKAAAKITKEFLTVLDSFERAAESVVTETEREEKINSAYQSINKQFVKTLQKLEIEPIESLGEQFDASIHSAIQQQESTEYAEGVVMLQFQRGYRIKERLIRPSMCIVSSGPGPDGDATEPAETGVAEEAGLE